MMPMILIESNELEKQQNKFNTKLGNNWPVNLFLKSQPFIEKSTIFQKVNLFLKSQPFIKFEINRQPSTNLTATNVHT